MVILLPRSAPWSSKRSEASCFLPLAPLEQEVAEGNDPIRRGLPSAASRLRLREPSAFPSSYTDESTRAARLTGAFTQQHQAAPLDGQRHRESHQDLFPLLRRPTRSSPGGHRSHARARDPCHAKAWPCRRKLLPPPLAGECFCHRKLWPPPLLTSRELKEGFSLPLESVALQQETAALST